jgi:hypothetical protein
MFFELYRHLEQRHRHEHVAGCKLSVDRPWRGDREVEIFVAALGASNFT